MQQTMRLLANDCPYPKASPPSQVALAGECKDAIATGQGAHLLALQRLDKGSLLAADVGACTVVDLEEVGGGRRV